MNRNNTLPIAAEGFKKIGYLLLVLFFFALLDLEILQTLTFILLIATLWVFRNPERSSAYLNSSNTALSMCDGTVSEVDESDTEYRKIVINNTYMDVALLRAPFEGTISDLKITHGAHLSQSDSHSFAVNERASYTLNDAQDNTLLIEHIIFNSIHSIDISTFEFQKISRSQRYGLMLKGKTTIYLPRTARISVSVGNEVLAGETILAYL